MSYGVKFCPECGTCINDSSIKVIKTFNSNNTKTSNKRNSYNQKWEWVLITVFLALLIGVGLWGLIQSLSEHYTNNIVHDDVRESTWVNQKINKDNTIVSSFETLSTSTIDLNGTTVKLWIKMMVAEKSGPGSETIYGDSQPIIVFGFVDAETPLETDADAAIIYHTVFSSNNRLSSYFKPGTASIKKGGKVTSFPINIPDIYKGVWNVYCYYPEFSYNEYEMMNNKMDVVKLEIDLVKIDKFDITVPTTEGDKTFYFTMSEHF